MHRVLSKSEARIVRVIGQTLYPRDRKIPVDGIDAGIVDYIDDFLARCPRVQRLQVRALLRGIDTGFALWAGQPTARFTDGEAEDRSAYLESWGSSEIYLRRMAFDGLKVIFNMAYIDSPAVLEATGIELRSSGPERAESGEQEQAESA